MNFMAQGKEVEFMFATALNTYAFVCIYVVRWRTTDFTVQYTTRAISCNCDRFVVKHRFDGKLRRWSRAETDNRNVSGCCIITCCHEYFKNQPKIREAQNE